MVKGICKSVSWVPAERVPFTLMFVLEVGGWSVHPISVAEAFASKRGSLPAEENMTGFPKRRCEFPLLTTQIFRPQAKELSSPLRAVSVSRRRSESVFVCNRLVLRLYAESSPASVVIWSAKVSRGSFTFLSELRMVRV